MPKQNIIQAKFNPKSKVGGILQDIKQSEINTSETVRELLMIHCGFEHLRDRGATEEELQKHCLYGIAVLQSKIEVLSLQLKAVSSTSSRPIFDEAKKEVQSKSEKKQDRVKTNTFAESFLNYGG
jgi:hypothetical protein